jgi:hypothetical protein
MQHPKPTDTVGPTRAPTLGTTALTTVVFAGGATAIIAAASYPLIGAGLLFGAVLAALVRRGRRLRDRLTLPALGRIDRRTSARVNTARRSE